MDCMVHGVAKSQMDWITTASSALPQCNVAVFKNLQLVDDMTLCIENPKETTLKNYYDQ